MNHNIIKYAQKNFICLEHEDSFSSYCKTCRKNLCIACENKHSQHNLISLGKLFPNKNELDKRIEDLKQTIDKVKDEIKKIIDLLKAFIENINIYYNINNDIYSSFNNKFKNYEILKNIREISGSDVEKDLIKIINENGVWNKFKQIINIINTMENNEGNFIINKINNINESFNNIIKEKRNNVNNIHEKTGSHLKNQMTNNNNFNKNNNTKIIIISINLIID